MWERGKRQREKKKETLIIRNHDCITAKVGGDMHIECNAPKNGRRRRTILCLAMNSTPPGVLCEHVTDDRKCAEFESRLF